MHSSYFLSFQNIKVLSIRWVLHDKKFPLIIFYHLLFNLPVSLRGSQYNSPKDLSKKERTTGAYADPFIVS